MNELILALKEAQKRHVLRFCFRRDGKTSHYLIFVTKHPLGIKIMKDIMAPHCTGVYQGVPDYKHDPNDKNQPLLIEPQPLDELIHELLDYFAGKTKNFKQIFEEHSVDTNYRKINYKEALIQLEEEGRITVNPPANNRGKVAGKVSFKDNVEVTFPEKSKDKL